MLADSIEKIEASESFVYGVAGEWGSGKSTVLNFVVDYLSQIAEGGLEQRTKPAIVRFNPWWFTGTGALLESFFAAFETVLDPPTRKQAQGLLKKLKIAPTMLRLVGKGANTYPLTNIHWHFR